MKTIITITAVAIAMGGFMLWNTFRMPSKFGDFKGAQPVEVAALVERPSQYVGKLVAVEGQVTEQCQAMGCFFTIPAGKRKLRVDLEEIAMNAPRHEGGHARVEGQLVPYGDGYQLYASAIEFK